MLRLLSQRCVGAVLRRPVQSCPIQLQLRCQTHSEQCAQLSTSTTAAATTSNSAAASLQCVGVLGAGQMGTGIAYVSALHAKRRTVLLDSSSEQLVKSHQFITQLFAKDVTKQKLTQHQADDALQRLSWCKEMSELDSKYNASIVIEAATESLSVKRELFRQLAQQMSPHCILATNTSSISITACAAAAARGSLAKESSQSTSLTSATAQQSAARVIGMHFMNPVPVMKLVEVITALQTSDATLQATLGLARDMQKTCTHSADRPGFVANRLLMPYINEAVFALQDGIASRDDIDATMRLGCGMPMGPLQLADFIGLDTCLAIMRVLHAELGEDKYRPAPLLVQYVEAGRLGKKSGLGFHQY